jgi:hypothetical protein
MMGYYFDDRAPALVEKVLNS